jgi:hypothetical protein
MKTHQDSASHFLNTKFNNTMDQKMKEGKKNQENKYDMNMHIKVEALFRPEYSTFSER